MTATDSGTRLQAALEEVTTLLERFTCARRVL